MNPTEYARPTFIRNNKVPAAVLLWAVLIALASVRRGALPNQQAMTALAVATVLVIISASVFPDAVTWILLIAVLAVAFQDADLITSYVNQGTAKLRGAFGQ